LRTAGDFNTFYSQSDPWGIANARFRDAALYRCIAPYARGRVLELGCGEGHLTQAIFAQARSVHGVDISNLAIARAQARGLPNATFEVADFLEISFKGYDVVTAIECLYYLSPEEQRQILGKIAAEHPGKLLIVTGPIVGRTSLRTYFTHEGLLSLFREQGISVQSFHNLNLRRQGAASTLADRLFARLPFGHLALWVLPQAMVNQRCYLAFTKSR